MTRTETPPPEAPRRPAPRRRLLQFAVLCLLISWVPWAVLAVIGVTWLPLSYTILFAYEHLAGGVWAAILIHAAWNAADALMPDGGDLGVLAESGITFVIAAVVALLWRRQRVRRSGFQVGTGPGRYA
jgi:hypothetical protein